MSDFGSARSTRIQELTVAQRLVAAPLLVESLAGYYALLDVPDRDLIAALVAEMTEIGTELECGVALVEADGAVIGVFCGYPAEEVQPRQIASMYHLISMVDANLDSDILEASARHAAGIQRVPPDSYYIARIGVVPSAFERVLVTPSAFNTIAWRVVVMQREHYFEGFYSLLDQDRSIRFDRFDRGAAVEAELRGMLAYQRISTFSQGFYALRQDGPRVLITDLRMGQEPAYTFSFAIAERASPAQALAVPEQAGTRPELGKFLPWLWRRIGGDPTPPPR